MSRKKERLFAAILAASLVMMLTGGSVYARKTVETTQTFETGAVDIELENTTREKENITSSGEYEILPGQNVKLGMNVRCKAEKCYIRAKYDFDRYREILGGSIYGISDDWIFNPSDGFWYCKKAVDHSESKPFFEGLTIPENLPQEGNEGFSLVVTAEALQERNVEPDFSSKNPWKGVDAEYDVDIDYITAEFPSLRELSVTYQGDADRLIAVPEDFFSNLPVFMPGDTYEQTIELNNDSDTPSDLYFYSRSVGDALAQKLVLTIRTEINGEKKVVYEGSLACQKLEGGKNEVLLGRLNGREKGILTFTVSVPETLKNAASLQKGSVKWIFSTEHIVLPEKGKTPVPARSVYTGDGAAEDLWFVIMTAGCALFLSAIFLRKKILGTDRV